MSNRRAGTIMLYTGGAMLLGCMVVDLLAVWGAISWFGTGFKLSITLWLVGVIVAMLGAATR